MPFDLPARMYAPLPQEWVQLQPLPAPLTEVEQARVEAQRVRDLALLQQPAPKPVCWGCVKRKTESF
jgi:hypothetical protein